MFGVLKFRGCKKSAQEKYEHRLHYCGTCKAMGTTYGQHTRLLLNHDAVFLAELLTELGGATKPSGWERSFQSRNCFTMPSATDVPLPLKIAATATVVLTKFKIHDQIVDGGNRLKWAAAKALYADSFKKATGELAGLGLQESELWHWFDEQVKREREITSTARLRNAPSAVLTYLAEPTGAATATIYRHSAICIGASAETANLMGQFGQLFGKLVYILDAVTDYASDIASGAFNAIACSFETEREVAAIPYNIDKQVRDELAQLTTGLLNVLSKLPMERASVTRFSRRLRENLNRFSNQSGPYPEERQEKPTLHVDAEEDEGDVAGAAPKRLRRKQAQQQLGSGGGPGSDPGCCAWNESDACCDACDCLSCGTEGCCTPSPGTCCLESCCTSGSIDCCCSSSSADCCGAGSADCCGSGSCDCCSGCGDCGSCDCGGCNCN